MKGLTYFITKKIYISLIPFIVSIIVFSVILTYFQFITLRTQRIAIEHDALNLYALRITEKIKNVLEDVYFLASQTSTASLNNDIQPLSDTYRAFIRQKTAYQRIAYLDNNGNYQILIQTPFQHIYSDISPREHAKLDVLTTLSENEVMVFHSPADPKRSPLYLYTGVYQGQRRTGFIEFIVPLEYITEIFKKRMPESIGRLGISDNTGTLSWLANQRYNDSTADNQDLSFFEKEIKSSPSTSGILYSKRGIGVYDIITPINKDLRIKLNDSQSVKIRSSTSRKIRYLISYIPNSYLWGKLCISIGFLLVIDLLFLFITAFLLNTAHKINERKTKIEAELENTIERYQEMLNTIGNPIIMCNEYAKISYCNAAFTRLTGYLAEEIVGKPFNEFVAENSKVDMQRAADYFEHNDTGAFEMMLTKKGGGVIYAILSVTVMRDQEHRYRGSLCMVNDISSMKKAQETLVEDSYIFENMPGLIFWTAADGKIIKSNQSAAELISPLTGFNIFSLLPGAREQADGNELYSFEQEIRSKTYSIIGKYDPSSDTRFFYCTDITQIKEIEKKLIASDLLNRSLLNAVPFAMRIITRELDELYRKSGANISQENTEFWEWIDQYDKEAVVLEAHEETERNSYGEYYEIIRTDMLYAAQDCVLEIIQDITQRKKNEDEIRRLSVGVEQSANPVLITDEKGIIVFVNRAFETISGFTREYAIGKSPNILKSGTHTKQFYTDLWNTIKNGRVWTGEFFNRRGNGTTYWEKAVITPIKNDKGKIVNYIAVKEDITKAREAAEALRKAKDEAEKDSSLKSEFLANMSHEIRTPMNAIIGFTDMLMDEEADPVKMERLKVIKNSGNALLELINDILDLSKIEAGKIEIENTQFSLPNLCTFVVSLFDEKIKHKNLGFHLSIEHETPESVIGDERRISQILINLLSNAVKFTTEGEINFEVSYKKPNMIFTIADTGIGIAKNKLEAIFNAFEQADSSTERHFGGTGLGLAISKKLAELMNGTILVESVEKKGSRFSLIIPLTPQMPKTALQDEDTEKRADKNIHIETKTAEPLEKTIVQEPFWQTSPEILTAEDNLLNRQLMAAILKKMQLHCDFAENGEIALTMLRAKKYDILLLDMQMPILDGMGVLNAVRKDPELKELYVIAVTANAIKGERERYIEAGCDEYISKPIAKKDLEEKIIKAVAHEGTIQYAYTTVHTEKKAQKNLVLQNDADRELVLLCCKTLEENIAIFKPAAVLGTAHRLQKLSDHYTAQTLFDQLTESAETFDEKKLAEVLQMMKDMI